MNNLIFVLTQKTQSNSDNLSGAALSIEVPTRVFSHHWLNATRDFILLSATQKNNEYGTGLLIL